jgi:MFS family permease
MASEMLYPVMPIYLKSIGFSVVLIGILEGIAEATAGLSKGYFGKLSDISARRVSFVQWGYALSALAKPLMVLFTSPWWIFLVRTTDRFGKGIRTGARDALLSAEATPQTKAKVFGFHRSMDTLGAVIGPLAALVYLYFFPEDYVTLFILAFVPGFLAIFASLKLSEKREIKSGKGSSVHFFSFLNYWSQSPLQYRQLVVGLLVFALFNSSDVFLLLQAKNIGMNDTQVIGLYIFYNLIYALTSLPLGILADKIGMKPIFILGLLMFTLVYFGIGWSTQPMVLVGLFFLYGIYAAATEGISKAWITNLIPKDHTATAIGTFAAFQSICTLLASSITGIIWFQWGASAAFFTTATATVLVVLYMLFAVKGVRGKV